MTEETSDISFMALSLYSLLPSRGLHRKPRERVVFLSIHPVFSQYYQAHHCKLTKRPTPEVSNLYLYPCPPSIPPPYHLYHHIGLTISCLIFLFTLATTWNPDFPDYPIIRKGIPEQTKHWPYTLQGKLDPATPILCSDFQPYQIQCPSSITNIL